ncbi:MAG: hypothetical protein RIQ71_511 [Verrucomicrobiota bacterium]|jgi:hypothetical protein
MTKSKPNRPLSRALRILFFLAANSSAFASATPDDTAKVLAGLPPASGSPLEPLTVDAPYKAQTAMFAEMWRRFEDRQLSHVRTWADRELPAVRQQSPVLYYTFSGPDIVYANTFFPDCKTYVMCGLEPVGHAPDLLEVPQGRLADSLHRLYGSLDTVLALGFFKTKDMGADFRNPELPGITPVLMTFLARLGKNVRSVDLVAVDRDGNESPRAASDDSGDNATPGVKITFDSGAGTPGQTVYYFSTNISNEGVEKNPGFANFCRKLEPGAGLVKAASYLLHTSPFSATRDFLMERCKFILQDDTGIPATVYSEGKWEMHPYGRYVRPIEMFRGYYQKKLADVHSAVAEPLDFGIGYYYRIADCNMLLASRDENSVVVAVAPPTPPPAAPVAAAPSFPTPAPAVAAVMASNDAVSGSPRKTLVELEDEELQIRNNESLTKKERMQKLREIWKQQLAVMGKKAA